MEMKERLEQERKKYEELESKKRQEILEAKEKNAKDLEGRALQIQKLREKRAGATKIFYEDKARIEREREIQEEKARQESALKLAEELKVIDILESHYEIGFPWIEESHGTLKSSARRPYHHQPIFIYIAPWQWRCCFDEYIFYLVI